MSIVTNNNHARLPCDNMEENSQNTAISQKPSQGSAHRTAKEPVRYRAACDRCHGKKIRCQKEPGAIDCVECTKHITDCRFTIFRKDIKRTQYLQRKKKTSVECQLTGSAEYVTASKEEDFPQNSVGDSTRKPNSPLSSSE